MRSTTRTREERMPAAVAPTRSGRTSEAGSRARRYPFDLLESKLLPPQGRGGTVPRGELIEIVDGSRATPVVVLSAGPGWGKTTLLAQWASGRSARLHGYPWTRGTTIRSSC